MAFSLGAGKFCNCVIRSSKRGLVETMKPTIYGHLLFLKNRNFKVSFGKKMTSKKCEADYCKKPSHCLPTNNSRLPRAPAPTVTSIAEALSTLPPQWHRKWISMSSQLL